MALTLHYCKFLKVIVICSIVIFFSACDKMKYDELESVTITGNYSSAITKAGLNKKEWSNLLEHYNGLNKKAAPKARIKQTKLYITIDTTLAVNRYLNTVNNSWPGLLSIEVYKEPRIIKGTINGDNHVDLINIYGKDYYKIQYEYFKTGNINKAIDDIINLLLENFQNKLVSGKGRYSTTDVMAWTSALVNFTTGLVKPRDNFAGRLLKPFWLFSNYVVGITDTFRSGLYFIIVIFYFGFWLLFMMLNDSIEDNSKSKKMWHFVINLFKAFFLIILITYLYYLYTPNIENVLLLSKIYGFETSALNNHYLNYISSKSNTLITVLTIIVFLLHELYKKVLITKILPAANDDTPDGLEIGRVMLSFVVFCLIFDKSIVLAILCFYIVDLIHILLLLKVIWSGNKNKRFQV